MREVHSRLYADLFWAADSCGYTSVPSSRSTSGGRSSCISCLLFLGLTADASSLWICASLRGSQCSSYSCSHLLRMAIFRSTRCQRRTGLSSLSSATLHDIQSLPFSPNWFISWAIALAVPACHTCGIRTLGALSLATCMIHLATGPSLLCGSSSSSPLFSALFSSSFPNLAPTCGLNGLTSVHRSGLGTIAITMATAGPASSGSTAAPPRSRIWWLALHAKKCAYVLTSVWHNGQFLHSACG
ncbi:hypothetical protein GGI08_001543 [Coemansia sp. S2]|nr:hypothetical protein GGI08_001543 [Coemansia sp. S2]